MVETLADQALMRRGPLDDVPLPSGEAFALAPAPAATRFILRGDDAAARALGGAFGVDLPRRPGAAARAGERAAIWLGPDEWLLIAQGEEPAALGAALEAALGDHAHSLVDVSQRQIGLDVSGVQARRALSAGCPLDLRDGSFPVGFATRTMLSKSEIVLWRRGPLAYRIEVWRSFAGYVADVLTEAARRAAPT